jgi:hypothetical protein
LQEPYIEPYDDLGSLQTALNLAYDDSALYGRLDLRRAHFKKSFEMYFPIKSFQGEDKDVNLSFMFHCKFSKVRMLEWKEREHEEKYYFSWNDPGMVNSLRQCGLLKFFKIQSMRAQLRLLEYLVHMWVVNQQAFHVGSHILMIDIEDIYFLTGLSHRGSRVTLIGSRGGGEPMSHYINAHCVPGTQKHSGKVAIRDVCDLPLRTIL